MINLSPDCFRLIQIATTKAQETRVMKARRHEMHALETPEAS